jgi:hypothetical protein
MHGPLNVKISNIWMMVNTNLERMWMEAMVGSHELSLPLFGRTELKHEKH